ncbi:hypothetical protein Pmani_032621 [Petrolisthes manimaculis]|uniref:Uncharacterized protein n=1 Tax=Petrolisthes manimaculis TaxID=1843537 RepID=A0AAE1TQX3_9EUCA|nr:hypothetical protein Pmani_032621 [Petrolisthes manimaculis]
MVVIGEVCNATFRVTKIDVSGTTSSNTLLLIFKLPRDDERGPRLLYSKLSSPFQDTPDGCVCEDHDFHTLYSSYRDSCARTTEAPVPPPPLGVSERPLPPSPSVRRQW